MSKRRTTVSIVVFPECDPSIIYGVFDTLWAAGRMPSTLQENLGEPLFEPQLVSAEAGPLKLVTGVTVVTQASVADVQATDVVFVPNIIVTAPQNLRALDRRLLKWIVKMHARGSQVYAVCGGSLVLAEAGLLDGAEATTHSAYAPLFREQYPNIALHVERIIVQSGPGHSLVCAGGASSWQDLALLLIAKHAGTKEAIRISKLFLYQWHREGQLPYASMIRNVSHGDAVILRCQEWIAQNYDRADIVAELVRRAGIPKRTFDRRFRAVTGYSPLAYVQALRIEEAKHMLETTATAVDEVGREVGYEDAASFRRLFQRLAGMTPSEYRRKFRPPSIVPAAKSDRVARRPLGSAKRRTTPPRLRAGLRSISA
jgi:transcriptional regulator GlxA family with amidase domain